MPNDLDAIYNELRRLKKEGVDHVFIDDSTKALLKPAPEATKPRERGKPVEHTALAELIKKPHEVVSTQPKKEVGKRPEAQKLPDSPIIDVPEGDIETQFKWLKDKVLNCPVCNQHLEQDEKVVFGDGKIGADILFCGEAPGTDEAATGKPFVGSAGQLLGKIIKAMGLSRQEVYCTNIMKWRPENDKPYGNRPPTQEEMAFCLPYFRAEVEIIQPKVIVALGNTVVNGLLGPDPTRKMGSIRGTWHAFQDVPTVVTFHPSYLLRNNTLKTKRMAWVDLLSVMEKVDLPISEKQQGFFL